MFIIPLLNFGISRKNKNKVFKTIVLYWKKLIVQVIVSLYLKMCIFWFYVFIMNLYENDVYSS